METKPLKLVVIGGVAGGATAAAKARRENEHAEIVLFERGAFVSWANCGLPYYVSGEINDRTKLFLQTPEGFWNRYRIKVKVSHSVIKIDREAKKVHVTNLVTNENFTESYDRLILAPGAGAIVPPLNGVNNPNVFVVKTVPDSDKLKKYIAEKKPVNAVIIGGGFIGLETAEAFHKLKMKVTIVELMNQILPPFDPDMAKIVQFHLQNIGINMITGDGVKGFTTDNGTATHVELNSGKTVPCDLVILSIGVRPEIQLAKDCGLKIGVTGGIAVNEYQQTSDPDIFAAGDATELVHLVTGKPARIALAGPANKQGRVAGSNAVNGAKIKFSGAIGTSIVECLGVTAGMTGLSEKAAVSEKIPVDVSIVHALDHASFYPGGHMLHIKLMSRKDNGRILGAQIVGEYGVDKRIDVIATAIAGKLTVEDLENLDLAYSPQYGSAKDPISLAGFVASDVLRGEEEHLTVAEYEELVKQGQEQVQLVDVRTLKEFKDGTISGAKNLPVDDLREKLGELDKEKPVIVFCRVGLRGYVAYRILVQNGFKHVKNLTGGYISFTGQL